MLGRPLSFALAGTVGAATLTAASAPSPLYPVYQAEWGFSSFVLTLVFAVYVFALLGSLLTVGSLSDRVGRRPVASAALVLLALGMVLFALADGTGWLVAARIVQGLAVGAAAGTTTALVVDTAPSAATGAVVSSSAPLLGIAVGAVLSGALVEHAPYPEHLVFWVLAALYVLLAALLWAIPEQRRAAPAGPLLRSLLPSLGLPRETRPVFVGHLPAMAATWALGGLYLSLGSSVLANLLGVEDHLVVGLVLGVFFLAGVAGTVASIRLPAVTGAVLGYGTLGGGVLVTIAAVLADSLPVYLVGSVVAGLGFGGTFRAVVSDLGAAAPAARRGEVFATMFVVSYLAFSVPALVAGLAVDSWGLRTTVVAYAGLDVVLVVAAAGAAALRGRARRSALRA
ncbi:MFS transporter [Nocardioides sp. GY 10127]|uniref:MFS transporter n=1 Tax=Nocardioides sp. GY 10127 TaxID=2569762 RepID=UPI0010A750CD|nr:MFS transporter [Nocardioides sp. GY 10127]TIC85532.1 MFS transporter [Nocardioides sp. GY 10127]